MAVDYKQSNDPAVIAIPHICPNPFPWSHFFWNISLFSQRYEGRIRGAGRLRHLLQTIASPTALVQRHLGWEDFNFPGSHQILDLFPEKIDLVHLHNLHSNYFDLRFLPSLSKQVPTLLTLLDTWLFAGHCGYSLGCERWLTGCGHCPYLSLYSPIKRDASGFNWQRKKEIYSQSQLFVATPCEWMSNRLTKSILMQSVREIRVIPSGTDQTIFHPGNRREARQSLGLPMDAQILLFVGQGTRANPFKDYATMERAIQVVSSQLKDKNVIFLSLGYEGKSKPYENSMIRHIPYSLDVTRVVKYYQASDIYLHAAHEDTFPNVVLEALSCGVPVIGTAVGGIPEQILDGETGFLIQHQDAVAMAQRILTLLGDTSLCQKMGLQAQEYARKHLSVDLAVERYRDYYVHIQEAYGRS
ncbi:MAG TPA: glycosyltransferase [Anaerolineaceae bacterium]|nr:glycosyltransferase [Anaerolineaceae bacterium]